MKDLMKGSMAALALMLASACGPAQETPEPVDNLPDEQNDPGAVPETDPEPPNDPGDVDPIRFQTRR
ncbi:hypothetical protein [Aquisalinus flavus]|uniref:Uncharacterized protein n=1 Tax=Aquisalinus flavus TaxID=1526572 RepID=A0A8J2V494_9PROT|nr:hypothetical protein [Aquisalinus flavus]MBD0427865.1 hypothetical protein [Aquisalinus flavus]UNE47628.1 hypothetical protein FF099_05960 [Aquisalinus flavus]GGD04497.1 hypothetical protein GCM10011342_11820 [Aquisalinus flavus]